eukprot:6636191-Alexandrium_andersonii.AAC.1
MLTGLFGDAAAHFGSLMMVIFGEPVKLFDTAAEYISSLVMAIPGVELVKLIGFATECFGD